MDENWLQLRVSDGGSRLDRFLAAELPALSRSAMRRLIDDGRVRVGGAPAKASYKVRPGDEIAILLPETEPAAPEPEQIPLDVVFEDEALLVVNKPAGMVVHPAPGHTGGTLVNAILARYPQLAGEAQDTRPGIVHRLDRYTSGLILVAKSEAIRRALQRQFQERRVSKEYAALVEGRLPAGRGRIEAPIGRDSHHRQRMAVLPGGREALTEYRVVAYLATEMGPLAGEYTLIDVEPKTGRTHQIRVHLASIGYPVVGDSIYGRRRARRQAPRHFLHAQRLGLTHPVTGQALEFIAPLPKDLADVLHALGYPPGGSGEAAE